MSVLAAEETEIQRITHTHCFKLYHVWTRDISVESINRLLVTE